METWDDDQKKKYAEALGALKSIEVEPSPYMKTRILANVKEQQKQTAKSFNWIYALMGSAVTAALTVVISFQFLMQPEGTIVELGKPYMVKADIRMMEELHPSYVKVELVGNVQFSSERFKQIQQMRELTLSWEKMAGKQYLPVVVKGVEQGESHVRIHFYDSNNNIIKTQDYHFDFKKGSS